MAIRLAKKVRGVIVNCDSMQIYSNLQILTARPSKKDCEIIEHKLYGYVDPSIRYNVVKWCNDIVNIINNNKYLETPLVIVGGSGLYIHSLLNGIINIPPIPEKLKKESEYIINSIGINDFINKIKLFDSESLKAISSNDSVRIKRIWEVYQATGIKLSQWKKQSNKKFLNNIKFNIFLFLPPRDKIYLNVNNRFKNMIKEGALEEVKNLLKLKLDKSLPIMRAHGVPEISSYLSNLTTLEECISKSQQVTRNYVKRQLTWWRSSNLPITQALDKFPNEIDENMIKI